MKTGWFGVLVGLLLLASAAAHALAGWPPFRESLTGAGVEADEVGALAAGWYFGSAAMLAFGLLVLQQARRRLRSQRVDGGPLWIVALAYVAFGAAAFALRGGNPHFLGFVATGCLTALFARLAGR